MLATPARSSPVLASARITGTKTSTGTTGWTRVKRSSKGEANIGGDARSSSVLSMAREAIPRRRRWKGHRLLVDAIAPHDAPVHRLHRAVHVPVGLEDPPHLAPCLRGELGHVEVLHVGRGGDAGVLEGGLDAQEADPPPVGQLPAAQEVPPAERQ